MMNLRMIAFLFTTILILNGCYKDNIIFEPNEEIPEVPKGDISSFYENIPDEFVSFEMDANEDFLIVTDNNTIIEIKGGSFIDASGDLVAGDIDFKYIEILNAAQYSLYGLPTISDKQMLRSEGVFRFEASKDGKALKLKGEKAINVRLPSDDPEPGMQLFVGEGEGDDFNWVVSDVAAGTDNNIFINEWVLQLDSTNQEIVSGFGYEFNCQLFEWINVDIFNDVPEENKTTVCVELPEIYTNQNTVIFMYFNDLNSILGMRGDPDKMNWCEPYGATPKGSNVTFIVISSQAEDVYHFALVPAVIKENHLEFIEPEEKTFDEIIIAIQDL